MDPARILTNFGDPAAWPNGRADLTLGTRFDSCSWPIWSERLDQPNRHLILWRNPQHLDSPGRWHGVDEWARKPGQTSREWAAIPLKVPWGNGWGGDGGTTDNGCIIELADGSRLEIQGLSPVNIVDAVLINLRAGRTIATTSHFRADCVVHRRPGVTPRSAMGPKWRSDGLLHPAHLRSMVGDELALTVFPLQFGPDGKAVDGGWVESPGPKPPYRKDIKRAGNDPRLIPCFQAFRLDISDAQIERWITAIGTPVALVESRRWFARNLRGWCHDIDRPVHPKPTMRATMSGTGSTNINSVGDRNPRVKAQWAACGVTSDAIARRLGDRILEHGELVAA